MAVQLQDGDPRQVGRYTLQGRLGAGELGQVFLGWSPTGQPVAVKIIHPHLVADPEFRGRLAREANLARQVGNAYTIPVIDAAPNAPLPWLVTPYVNGPSLATAVAVAGPLPVRSVLALAAGLAEGLRAAHAAGLTHRDLKPTNVLLAADGPRLVDFGIAQAIDRSQASPGGLPGFTSPEHAAGLAAGPASDIFSLGAVLLYAATGPRMPYFAGHLDELSGELRPLIEHCMAADAAARPTAAEFLAELLAAHPAAINLAGWLPGGVLPTTNGWPGQAAPAAPFGTPAAPPPGNPAPAPPFPATPPADAVVFRARPAPAWPTAPIRRRLPSRRLRTHAWLMSVVALACAVLGVGTVYIIHPWPYPVLRPTGLTASQRSTDSIILGWSGPASGPIPDKYVILQDGAAVATVPGNVSQFDDKDLAPATSYNFQVVAYRGGVRSQTSQGFRVATKAPPLADALLTSSFLVSEKISSGGSSVQGDKDGDTYSDNLTFYSGCTQGPCSTLLSGSIDNEPFTVKLNPTTGGNYSGTDQINDYYYCGDNQNDHVDSTLTVTVKATAAHAVDGTWQASKLTGSMVWSVNPSVSQSDTCSSGQVIFDISG